MKPEGEIGITEEEFDDRIADHYRSRNLDYLEKNGVRLPYDANDECQSQALSNLGRINIEKRLASLKSKFEQSGNPFYVWEGILIASTQHYDSNSNQNPKHEPFPEWIRNYLTNTAFQIDQVFVKKIPPKDGLRERIGAILGFKGKIHNSIRREKKRQRASEVYRAARLIFLPGKELTDKQIRKIIGRKFDMSPETIKDLK